MHSKKITQRIKNLYKNLHPYSLDYDDAYYKDKNQNKTDIDSTYGEILPNAVSKLINNLTIKEDDVFVDLGCGNGKVVVQFYLQTPVKESLGIEFSTTRYNQAKKVLENIKEKKHKKISYIRNNFLNVDVSHGTIFYSASTCFTDETMFKIWNKLMENKNLNAIIILKDFPENCNFSRVKGTRKFKVGCSWAMSEAKIYYF